MKGSAIFVDTSIQIARFFREKSMKDQIEERLSNYDIAVSSSIVLQEFKRRVLNEALYLLNKLNDKGSYQKVKRHIEHGLPIQYKKSRRKQQICLQTLETIFELGETNDAELTERAIRYLRDLLKFGLTLFRQSLGHIIEGTNCYLSRQSVIELKPYERYQIGEKRCSKVREHCPILEFLSGHNELGRNLLNFLETISEDQQTIEIKNSIVFLNEYLHGTIDVREKDPCLTVGDLLIALESNYIPNFYTMNYVESQYFCKALKQNLIVRPNNPEKDDEVFSFNAG